MNNLTRAFLLIGFVLLGTACTSAPKRQGFNLPPALSETFRNGELNGLQASTDGDLGIPNDSDLVQRVCVSKPQFNLYGQFVKTIVKCW